MDKILSGKKFDFKPATPQRPSIKDHKVKHIFYDPNREMDTLEQMQKCPQNWNPSEKISPEFIEYLLWIAKNSPSKQWEAYYDIFYTTDRDVLDELYQNTWGTTHSEDPPSSWRSPQMNASLYMVFVAKEPETKLNCHADGNLKANSNAARWENAYLSIGTAMGLVMRAANDHGYHTATNKNHSDLNGNCYWEKRLGILKEVLDGTKKIAFGVAVGHPKKKQKKFEYDQTELCIGASDGKNLTTLNENDPNWKKRHPITGENFQKVKIVDIREKETEVDPYGNKHNLPKEYLMPTVVGQDKKKSEIKIIEIKS